MMGLPCGPAPSPYGAFLCSPGVYVTAGCWCTSCTENRREMVWRWEHEELAARIEHDRLPWVRERRAWEKRRLRLWSLFVFLAVEWIASMFLAFYLQTVTNPVI